MRKCKFTESQIINILKEGERGVAATDICRNHGIGDSTYYTWKSRYGGMSVSELKRLKRL